MRILDRYITTEFLKVFILCMAGFVLVFLLIEITDKIKYYFEFNPPGWLMLKYFLVKIPGYLFYVIPLGILLGGMLSLFLMARHSEVIAMQANGIDALAIARPVLMIGVVGSLVLFAANETVIPWSNRYSEYIQDVEIAKKQDRTFFKKDQIWMRSPGSITHIRNFSGADQTLEHVTVVQWDDDYTFKERLYADKAKWWKDRWIFYGVNITRKTADGRFEVETVPSMVGPLDKPPADFGRVERLAKEMNLVQLGSYIDKLAAEGHSPTRYLVDWHDKIAFPWVCLIMAALGVPFAVRASPRAGGVALGLTISVAVAFCYWIGHTFFIALGHGGYIPPIIAAWGANVIFGLSAAILLLHAGT
ncbi:MAG: LPS export ABC transporter permease LptG [Thermodesulfobacteriota bacterium]